MDRLAIARRRLRSLRLTGPRLDSPEDAVRWLGAVQSQDYAPAKWAIAQRLGAMRDPAIEEAFAAGRILRTHVLRPTWHFVLPEDLRWMLALTAPRIRAFMGYYDRQLGIDARAKAQTSARLVEALRGGRQLTRTELGARLGATGQRLGHLMMHAELDALVCSGAPRGKQQTYALVEERVAPARALDPDEALALLTVRYFTSHGPATAKDFHWWSSLPLAEIRRGLELAGARLEREVVDDLTFWHAGSTPRRSAAPIVHLVQAYDEYSVGYSESKHLLGGSATAVREVFNHVVFVDGIYAGRWKRTIAKREVAIEVALGVRLDDGAAAALRSAADAHGAFLDLPASLVTRQPAAPRRGSRATPARAGRAAPPPRARGRRRGP